MAGTPGCAKLIPERMAFSAISRPAHALVGVLLLPLAALFTADASAETTTPVEITMLGPGAVRILLTRGTTFPCDSGDNRRIVEGKFGAGEVVHATTPDRCACFQQTYAPFADVDWGAASMVCRPQICTNIGRKKCVPAPDPTIRLSVGSKRTPR